jgi:micrococcal nuclease
MHTFSAALLLAACNPGGDTVTATVTSVVDGDTVDISTGERVRYLMVDTPELGSSDCFAAEARQFNIDLVLGKQVTLALDVEPEDQFGRTLAYVTVDGVEVNARLVDRGYACVLHIPPNGTDRKAEFDALEAAAKAAGRGMWGNCAEVACEN